MIEASVIDPITSREETSPPFQPGVAGAIGGLRRARGLAWLNHRASFAIGMPALALLSLVTSLYIPRLIGPTEFGAYALLLNLFRYAGRSDLGLSQLADKMLSGGTDGGIAQQLLDVRFRLGALALLVVTPAAAFGGVWIGLSPLDASLAVAAGVFAMMCGGPSSVFRAKGFIWEYTALAFMFSLGFIVPRLFGFYVGGVTGCFACLLVWYVGVAAAFAMRLVIRKGSRAGLAKSETMAIAPTLRTCLPLFAFAGTWVVFLSLNRWISAILSGPRELGLFALGANLAVTGVTTFAQVGDIRYPRLLASFVRSGSFSASKVIEREGLAIAAVVAIGSAAFACLARPILETAFPNYAGAAPAAVAMVAACIPMTVVAWFLPVVIARTRSPLRDAAVVFFIPSVTTLVAMVLGNRLAGVTGQGWGCCIGSVALLACFAAAMHRSAILRANAALRLTAIGCLMILPTVAIAMGPIAAARYLATNAASKAATSAVATDLPTSGGGLTSMVPPNGWDRVFFEDFRSLSLWNGHEGIWETSYPNGSRTNADNQEEEYYASQFAPSQIQPFSIRPAGGLVITARPLSSDWRSKTELHYASGLLSSARTFSFMYGYVSMRAEVPRGKGLWPAFWLLPKSRTWPPEIDVMEVLGDETKLYYATIHSIDVGRRGQVQSVIATPDLSAGLHDYGMLWTSERIAWFFDEKQVAETSTPADMHTPMYLLVNLAVGGKWPGSPDSSTIFPAMMRVHSVGVWQTPRSARPSVQSARERDYKAVQLGKHP